MGSYLSPQERDEWLKERGKASPFTQNGIIAFLATWGFSIIQMRYLAWLDFPYIGSILLSILYVNYCRRRNPAPTELGTFLAPYVMLTVSVSIALVLMSQTNLFELKGKTKEIADLLYYHSSNGWTFLLLVAFSHIVRFLNERFRK